MKKNNVLLIGSGGREHALSWKIKQSPLLNNLFIAPGNAGTSSCGTNVFLDINNFNEIKNFVLKKNINLIVIGPEDPLVNGIHDFFLKDDETKHIPIIGPSKKGALLEGSKDFAKLFMQRHNIPTAKHSSFTAENLEEGYDFLTNMSAPYVLKADGLAAGKGVLILNNLENAKKELQLMLCKKKFGDASTNVLIEEYVRDIHALHANLENLNKELLLNYVFFLNQNPLYHAQEQYEHSLFPNHQ